MSIEPFAALGSLPVAPFVVPYDKLWCAAGADCHRATIDALTGAELVERATSEQPSVRVPARKEALALPGEQGFRMIPDVLAVLEHGNVWRQAAALDLLEAWRFTDRSIAAALASRVDDSDVAIARRIVGLLSLIAEPTHAEARAALVASQSSTDETIRYYAKTGLDRLARAVAARKADVPSDRESCAARGGDWAKFGLLEQFECDLPTPDAGRRCTDRQDCTSACVDPTKPRRPRNGIEGVCHDRTILRGRCLATINSGRTEGTVCSD